jgi:hypothetical protein
MSLSADDDFLVAIAHQALVAYATHQLGVCRTALQSWQAEAALGLEASDNPRAQHELAYYTTQVERWQGYMERLRTESNGVASVPALMSLDISPSG